MRQSRSTTLSALRVARARVPLHARAHVRPLATSTVLSLPRAPRSELRSTTRAAVTEPPPEATPPPAAVPEEPPHSPSPDGEGESPAKGASASDTDPASVPEPSATPPDDAPPTPSFPGVVTRLTSPPAPRGELPPDLQPLYHHLATSFVPANQSVGKDRLVLDSHAHPHPQHPHAPFGKVVLPASPPKERAGDDHVLALVTPFEGGDAYVSAAVEEVAGHLGADVVRLDLALAVGFDGPHAPLSETGIYAPPLAASSNPIFQTPAQSPDMHHAPPAEEEGDEDEPHMSMPNVIRLPMLAIGANGGPGFPGAPAPRAEIDDEWVAFFSGIINMQLPDESDAAPAARRIILLESTAAMAETFDVWWPSFLEAVRHRRRGPMHKGKRGSPRPTTVVLSVPPSLLPPHTAEPGPAPDEDVESSKERIRSVVEALGASVSAIHVDGHGDKEERPWWSSTEHDVGGRKRREERRLRTILDHGPASLLPFGASAPSQSTPSFPHPFLDMLMGRGKKRDDGSTAPIVWKSLPVIPAGRDIVAEQHERQFRRRVLNAAIMTRAIGQLGATLQEPQGMLDRVRRGRRRRYDLEREPGPEWGEEVIPWREAVDLASVAVGRAATRGGGTEVASAPLVLTWVDVEDARTVATDCDTAVEDTVTQYLSAYQADEQKQQQHRKAAGAGSTPVDRDGGTDAVVEALKKNKDLTKHEKRLLPCIVDAKKLATSSFDDVHLPYKTIDAIRTVISLPLLFPDAFAGGILKNHVTSGALLFGPPGTGKTLLARAIAAESGARMLAIQPSDVSDMWVGEGEKLVKAVFSLARKLSPCVVFIDEVDSLFGARSARDSSGGSKAHNQVLTEFMQEMDGLTSASANRDMRVVVVGATNRPFDLDDAVLRRLPRRLLVDLPTEEDRKAILGILLRDEKLAADISLDEIAKKTVGFSGSDLKHLCVAAALAAVKEMIDVPWKTGAASASTPAKVTPTSDSSGPRDGMRIAVDAEPEVAEVEQVTVPSVAGSVEATPEGDGQASASASAEAQASPSASATSESKDPATPASPIAKLEAAHLEKSQPSTTTSDTTPPPTDPDAAADPAADTAAAEAQAPPRSLKDRTLTAAHFATALTEIRPSSSEEGTLPELRKWAEQYGEGGKRAGKKSGFGRGFGFGEVDERKKQREGFGRVGDE